MGYSQFQQTHLSFLNINKFVFCEGMLQWFVSSYVTDAALSGYSIQPNDVKELYQVSHACRDEDHVVLQRIRQYFTTDAWQHVIDLMDNINKTDWKCGFCNDDLDNEQLGCDSCLERYHLKCVGLSQQPKSKQWFCRNCYNN